MNFRILLDHLTNYRTLSECIAKLISHSGFVVKFDFLPRRVVKPSPFPGHFKKCNFLLKYFVKIKSLFGSFTEPKPHSGRHVKLNSGSARSRKYKIENLRGRHVVTGGMLIYLISFLIGVGSTGISLKKTETQDDGVTQGSTLSKLTDPIGGSPSSEIGSINISDKTGLDSYLNKVDKSTYKSIESKSIPASPEMTVPVTFLKKIFLNNLGLNIIIIAGAFSLLAFSMIILVFNALQVGMLVKGIYNSYGLNLAATLVFPHLLVEVISHLLSLYLAYLILHQIIVPVVVKGEGIKLTSIKVLKILALFSLIIIITFIAALVEIYVTPKLI